MILLGFFAISMISEMQHVHDVGISFCNLILWCDFVPKYYIIHKINPAQIILARRSAVSVTLFVAHFINPFRGTAIDQW